MTNKAWSDEDTEKLLKLYVEEDIKDVYELAKIFGKGYRSVISKLVQQKVYIKEDPNGQNKGPSVKELLRSIENLLDIKLVNMNLTKKENLVMIVDGIKKLKDE